MGENSAKRLKKLYALKAFSNRFLRFNTNLSQPTDLVKRRAEKPNNLLHAQSTYTRLNSYNFDAGLDFDYTTGSEIRSRL
jgi:hypothetical protein